MSNLKRIKMKRAEVAESTGWYVAQDGNGNVHAYELKPRISDVQWITTGMGDYLRLDRLVEITDWPSDWKDSLTAPPVKRTCWCGVEMILMNHAVDGGTMFVRCGSYGAHGCGPRADTELHAWEAYDKMLRHGAGELDG